MRHIDHETPERITRIALLAVGSLSVAHGLAYTAALRRLDVLPGALQKLAELAPGNSALAILGGVWLAVGALTITARWRTPLRDPAWISTLAMTGLWGGAHLGGSFVVPGQQWLTGVVYLLVTAFVAVLWWACEVLEALTGVLRDLDRPIPRPAVVAAERAFWRRHRALPSPRPPSTQPRSPERRR